MYKCSRHRGTLTFICRWQTWMIYSHYFCPRHLQGELWGDRVFFSQTVFCLKPCRCQIWWKKKDLRCRRVTDHDPCMGREPASGQRRSVGGHTEVIHWLELIGVFFGFLLETHLKHRRNGGLMHFLTFDFAQCVDFLHLSVSVAHSHPRFFPQQSLMTLFLCDKSTIWQSDNRMNSVLAVPSTLCVLSRCVVIHGTSSPLWWRALLLMWFIFCWLSLPSSQRQIDRRN